MMGVWVRICLQYVIVYWMAELGPGWTQWLLHMNYSIPVRRQGENSSRKDDTDLYVKVSDSIQHIEKRCAFCDLANRVL